jgi:hypothetical protein
MHNEPKVELKDNKPQQIQMQRLIEGSFNDFDGEMVAKSLTDNPNLWDGFVFGRFGYSHLIELRDIGQGYLNADTMMMLTTKDRLKELLALIETWRADEVGYNYYEGNDRRTRKFVSEGTAPFHENIHDKTRDLFMALGSDLEPNQVILRVWWD